jgi:hypothetical protein
LNVIAAPGQLNRYAALLLKAWQTRDVRLVVEVATIARDETRLRLYNADMWSRALHRVEWSARSTRARHNKSLDASGVSGLLVDNLFVTWLSPAASTQPFGFYSYERNDSRNCSRDNKHRSGKRTAMFRAGLSEGGTR